MDKLGFSYAVCSKWNPMLIYATNSGFGDAGEWAERPSYDGMSQAFTGVLTSNGGGPSHEPRELVSSQLGMCSVIQLPNPIRLQGLDILRCSRG